MLAASTFFSQFDDLGRYKSGDGEVEVRFLTGSGSPYAGSLFFKNELLVKVEMEGASPWEYPDQSPIDGVKFLLRFDGGVARSIVVNEGRITHKMDESTALSREKFMDHFRVARNLFVHSMRENHLLSIDPSSVVNVSARGALWLTPRSVEGFDPVFFPELGDSERDSLKSAVHQFEAVASQVPAEKPPTTEQLGEAVVSFSRIVEILNPYFPTMEESEKIQRALRTVRFPDWVVNWDFELGNSQDGEAAVWVSIFIEGFVARSDYGRFGSQIIPTIRRALATEGVDRWPYLRMNTSLEYKTA